MTVPAGTNKKDNNKICSAQQNKNQQSIMQHFYFTQHLISLVSEIFSIYFNIFSTAEYKSTIHNAAPLLYYTTPHFFPEKNFCFPQISSLSP
jgi:hypothetical protein